MGQGQDIRQVIVSEVDAGTRLDRILAARVPPLSRSRLKTLILAGEVAIGGNTIRDPDHRVNGGDVITLVIPAPEPATPVGEMIPLLIVYEDDSIIVIDKPSGLVVHPATGNWSGTLVNALIAHCGESLSGIGGVRRPGIVHRLDKDTTGLLVVAKTVTHWEVLERYPGPDRKPIAGLLACRLETGRTHQIRVHLAHIGHPLMGDPVYGAGFKTRASRLAPEAAEALAALGRQALHAYLLAIAHPVTGQPLEFRSELPADLARLRHSLGAQGALGQESPGKSKA